MDKSLEASRSFLERHKSVLALNEQLPPLFYRVYKGTTQRQLVELKSLNSHAAFIFILDDERQILIWVGSNCDESDVEVIRELGKDVLTRDYGEDRVDNNSVNIIYEKSDSSSNALLEVMMELLNSTTTAYYSKATTTERRLPIENSPISVGVIDPLFDNPNNEQELTSFELREASFAHPDHQTGTVPRVAFAPLEINTVVYVQVGEQWDLWIARGADHDIVTAIIDYLENLIEAQICDVVSNYNRDMVKNYYQIVYQGEERVCFRRPLKIFTDFEPPGKTVARPQQDAGVKSAIDRRLLDQKQSKRMASYFNDIRFESGTFDENDGDPLQSNSRSFYGVTSLNHHSHSQSMIEIARVQFTDVKPNINHEANCAFTTKQSDAEKEKLKAFFAPKELPEIGLDDVQAINEEHVRLIDALNINLAQRKEILAESARRPEVLLGWQVEIDYGLYAGIFVVIGFKKSLIMRKTMFHLCGEKGDECYVRLCRGSSGNMKKGIKFRPLRKVATISRLETVVREIENDDQNRNEQISSDIAVKALEVEEE